MGHLESRANRTRRGWRTSCEVQCAGTGIRAAFAVTRKVAYRPVSELPHSLAGYGTFFATPIASTIILCIS